MFLAQWGFYHTGIKYNFRKTAVLSGLLLEGIYGVAVAQGTNQRLLIGRLLVWFPWSQDKVSFGKILNPTLLLTPPVNLCMNYCNLHWTKASDKCKCIVNRGITRLFHKHWKVPHIHKKHHVNKMVFKGLNSCRLVNIWFVIIRTDVADKMQQLKM